MENIAYDIDGVLAIMCKRDKPYSKQKKTEREEYEKQRLVYYSNSPLLMRPKEPFYVISGRKEKYALISDEWLQKHKLKVIKSYYLKGAKNFRNISKFKIDTLKELKIDKFYEDDPKLIRAIQKALPDIEVVPIKRDTNNIKVIKTSKLTQNKIF